MIKRIFLFSLIFLSFTVSLSSCRTSAPLPCRELLGAVIQAESKLPAGKIYDLSAAEGENEYLPEHLINSLFCDGGAPSVRSSWIDAALFLPTSSHTCELAVILCDSPESTADTAELLLRRIDVLRTALSEGEHSAALASASVTIIGNYALLVISSDSEGAINAAFKLLK